jgi:hypothetical protein
MWKGLWRTLLVAALGVVMTGAAHVGAIADAPRSRTALQLPGIDPGATVVAAALADIDADGDLDVVAFDGSLDLLVWSNDGTGHFTRRYPTLDPDAGRITHDGAFDPGSGIAPASVVPGGSTSITAPDRLSRDLTPSVWRIASAAPLPHSRARLSRASRAPPLPARSA